MVVSQLVTHNIIAGNFVVDVAGEYIEGVVEQIAEDSFFELGVVPV